jgi:hypothetical protein
MKDRRGGGAEQTDEKESLMTCLFCHPPLGPVILNTSPEKEWGESVTENI